MSVDDRAIPAQSSRVQGLPEIEGASALGDSIHRGEQARRRKLRPWAILGAVIVTIATGGVTLSYTSIFGAQVVEVLGEEHLGPRQVLRAAGIGIGSNVVHLDESATEARLEMHPWILEASVETSIPQSIRISVTERSPLLVAELDGALSLVAGDGTVLGRAPWPPVFPEVTAADGAETSRHVVELAGAVVRPMSPGLRARVGSVVVSPDGSIILSIDRHVEVRYGTTHSAPAKARALRAILNFAERDGRGLISVDVSAPAAPTARFVGSPTPVTAPDPSADPSLV